MFGDISIFCDSLLYIVATEGYGARYVRMYVRDAGNFSGHCVHVGCAQ